MSICGRCGGTGRDPEHAGHCGECWPFDPAPRALEPATNGFVWCERCNGAVAVNHECPPARREPFSFLVEAAKQQERAELAEGLLLAAMFAHLQNVLRCTDGSVHSDWFGPCDESDGCVFCDAERKHEVRP